MDIRDQFVPLHGMIAIQINASVLCYTKEHIVGIARTLTADLDDQSKFDLLAGLSMQLVSNKERYFSALQQLYPRLKNALATNFPKYYPKYDFDERDSRKFIEAFLDAYHFSFHTVSWSKHYDVNDCALLNVSVRRSPNFVQRFLVRKLGDVLFELLFQKSDVVSVRGSSINFSLVLRNGRMFQFGVRGSVAESTA